MSAQALTILLVVLLLAANGFFVAAEFALVKAKPARLDLLAEAGSTRAQLNTYFREHLEAYLAACQLGITMASLGLGWVGEPAVSAVLEPVLVTVGLTGPQMHTAGFLVGFVLFSSLHIVIGEQVPKTLAIRKPEPVALWIAYPLHAFYRFTYPLNWTLNAAANLVLALFRVEQATHADVLTNEELRGVIQASEEHGELGTEQAEMLQNMFDFGDRTAAEVMLPRGQVDLLDASADAGTNAQIMREKGHSRFPLVDVSADDLLGIVLVKDVFNAALAGNASPWSDLRPFARKPLFVPETIPVQKLFEMMRVRRQHMVCVVDEYGAFAGIVTMEDLLEEIVGEIADELDEDLSRYPVRFCDSHWEAHGLTPLVDVEKITGLQVPADTQANTLSGLFAETLDRLPEPGDVAVIDGHTLTVLAMKDRHVEKVRIDVTAAEREAAEEQAAGTAES